MQKKVFVGSAGTGKTHLLVKSVVSLVEEGHAGKVLILVSSDCAVNMIKSRLGNLSDCVDINTVKSLCKKVLCDNNPQLQIMSNFRAWFTLMELIRSEAITIHSSYVLVKNKRSFISEVLEMIETASVNLINIERLPGIVGASDKLEDIKNIYEGYMDYCHQNNIIPEFEALSRSLGLLKGYGVKFSHILVDGYEHLCNGEIQALRLLMDSIPHATIFVDSALCDVKSISERWQDDEGQILELGVGYAGYMRLPANMADHINRLMGKYIYPKTKSRGENRPLTIVAENTSIDEAEYIARIIRRQTLLNKRQYSDFAIICRETSKHKKTLCDMMRKYSIPYSTGLDISQDHLVHFAFLSLQVIADYNDDDLVLKWLSSPTAMLDRADVYRAYRIARRTKTSLFRLISSKPSSFIKSRERLENLLEVLDFAKKEIQQGKNIWEIIRPMLVRIDAIEDEEPKAISEFIEMIKDIETVYPEKRRLRTLIGDIKAGLAMFAGSDGFSYEDSNSVSIMSIEESRGLELTVVFVPGMVNNFLPIRYPARQLLHGEDMSAVRDSLHSIDLPGVVSPSRWRECEKQLLYTAMTRAREELYLTFARQYPESEDCEPSTFLSDLLEGREISAENCAEYNIEYHDRPVSNSSGKPILPDQIVSRTEFEITCHSYISELDRMRYKSLEEVLEVLSSKGLFDNYVHAVPFGELPITPKNKFSYSSINSFLTCPRQYFLRYLIDMDMEYPPGSHFGNLIHTVLKEFHNVHRNLNGCDFDELWQEMKGMILSAWKGKFLDKYKKPLLYEAEFSNNRLQGQSYLRLAEEILESYLRAEYNRWEDDRCCNKLEEEFEFKLFDKYEITGRIDRIDKCYFEDNEIIDFKTSTRDKEAENALKSKFLNVDDDPEYKPKDYQLPIYYFAGLNKHGLNPKKLVIYQLRNISKQTGEPFRRELEIKDDDSRSSKSDKFLTKADLEIAKDEILKTLDRMIEGLYPPEPRDSRICETGCEFSFLCDGEEDEDIDE